MIPGKTLSASLTAQPVYIEDVFSTYLYTGNGSTQTITNGIDLSGEGGAVWFKSRSDIRDNNIVDSANGTSTFLVTNKTEASNTPSGVTSFNNNGFTLNGDTANNNQSTWTYASWTFRKAEKFFDVVTYTGDGTAGRTVSHNLGSVPGCIIVKCTSIGGDNWRVYHRSLGATKNLRLNGTDAENTATTIWNNTEPTSTDFTLGTGANVNASGETYVAYLFAHDAGGFGVSGTDNVVSCGSYTGNGSTTGPVINLGWEPQWVLIKRTNTTGSWFIFDNMRSFSSTSQVNVTLSPNLDSAEPAASTAYDVYPTSTGFQPNTVSTSFNASGSTYIYIAIRRGPMKTPTTGTSVFYPYAAAFPGNAVVTTGFPVDLQFQKDAGSVSDIRAVDRLRGVSSTPTSPSAAFPFLVTNTTDAESTGTGTTLNWNNTGFTVGNTYSTDPKHWAASFRRAPKFFDVVCYTGTGAVQTISHNLGIAPSIMIIKRRSSTAAWTIYPDSNTRYLNFDTSSAPTSSGVWNDTSPTASVFTVGTAGLTNAIGQTYVAYLFGNCPGVSSAGTYTGTGTTQQINCGFASGARFVLIKCRNNTGPWYVWDSARGIVAGNDPYLLLNSSAAEVTNTDYIDTYSQGFEISSTAPANINGNGSIFIYIAIA